MTKREAAKQALVGMIDELGTLETDVEPYRAKFARIDVLRASLRAAFANSDPGKMYQASGEKYQLLLGKAGNQSVVDKDALLKLVGPAKFAEIASVSIKSLEANAARDVLGAVVSLEAIGPRPLTVVPLDEK